MLLDREGFSPGQIDGKPGANFSHALAALQAAHKLPPSGRPDCDTWKALGGDSAEPTVASYTLTDADVKGPFDKIPPKLADQSKLDELGYQSVTEAIAERFHASPALLAQLNRGARDDRGQVDQGAWRDAVRSRTRSRCATRRRPTSPSRSRKRNRRCARRRADGTLVFFAPVSSGSIHDPLPPGDWKVTGVGWHPVFHYNPDLFWDAKADGREGDDQGGAEQPGRRRLDRAEPRALRPARHAGAGNIGHTQSHGCVRMTNWDAARVAALVKPGTAVTFK